MLPVQPPLLMIKIKSRTKKKTTKSSLYWAWRHVTTAAQVSVSWLTWIVSQTPCLLVQGCLHQSQKFFMHMKACVCANHRSSREALPADLVVLLLPFQFRYLSLTMDQTSTTMLNSKGKSRHPCLVLDLRGKAFRLSPLSTLFESF
jgi:hypothetical protein